MLIEKLKYLISDMTDDGKGSKIIGNYWISCKNLPGDDFNREIIKPSERDELPDGAVGIYCDGDFWAVACLPYWVVDIEVSDLISVIFPHVENPIILPDHGDYWWEAISNSNLEVPGEPFEKWVTITYKNGSSEEMRVMTAPTLEIIEIKKNHYHLDEGENVSLKIKRWVGGERIDVDCNEMDN